MTIIIDQESLNGSGKLVFCQRTRCVKLVRLYQLSCAHTPRVQDNVSVQYVTGD